MSIDVELKDHSIFASVPLLLKRVGRGDFCIHSRKIPQVTHGIDLCNKFHENIPRDEIMQAAFSSIIVDYYQGRIHMENMKDCLLYLFTPFLVEESIGKMDIFYLTTCTFKISV